MNRHDNIETILNGFGAATIALYRGLAVQTAIMAVGLIFYISFV